MVGLDGAKIVGSICSTVISCNGAQRAGKACLQNNELTGISHNSFNHAVVQFGVGVFLMVRT